MRMVLCSQLYKTLRWRHGNSHFPDMIVCLARDQRIDCLCKLQPDCPLSSHHHSPGLCKSNQKGDSPSRIFPRSGFLVLFSPPTGSAGERHAEMGVLGIPMLSLGSSILLTLRVSDLELQNSQTPTARRTHE